MQNSINTISELYSNFSQYKYAVDAVSYFIFGDKDDNIINKSIKGSYGKNSEICEVEISNIMLNFENSWSENMELLNEIISNLHTPGGKLSDYF